MDFPGGSCQGCTVTQGTQLCSPCCLPPFPPCCCCCCLLPFFCCLGAASCSAVAAAATSADAAQGRKLLHHRLLLLLLPVVKAAAGVAGLTWGAALSMAAAGLLLRALPKAPCRQAGLMLLQTASSWRSDACTFLHRNRQVTRVGKWTCAGASAAEPGCQAGAAVGGAAAAGSTAGPGPLYAAPPLTASLRRTCVSRDAAQTAGMVAVRRQLTKRHLHTQTSV